MAAEFLKRLASGQVRVRAHAVWAVFLSVVMATNAGCLSNRYTLSTGELLRQASLPPEQRGQRVQVLQQFGDRDNDPAPPADSWSTGQGPSIDLHVDGHGHGYSGSSGVRVGRPPGTPPRSIGAGGRGSPRGGGGSISLPSSGGNGGDGLAALAIVIVAVAVLAAAGLAVTEGIRYDGIVDMHPYQPVHIKDKNGQRWTRRLGDITPEEAAATSSAMVLDDEYPGIRFVERRPLDRAGMAFKVDLGGLSSYGMAGVASNIQLGFFPHHRLGILTGLALGGGTDDFQRSFQRHSVNLEAQWFPVSWSRLHPGIFLHAGQQVARDAEGTRTGLALGAGGILEVALTTRLAFTLRGDYTRARTGVVTGSWVDNTTYTAGLAIY